MDNDEREIEDRLGAIESEIAAAAARSKRAPSDITLVAASKHQPISRLKALYVSQMARGTPTILGENYVQEWEEKRSDLPSGIQAHLIGSLQRNKARPAVELFDVIESVHSLEIAQALDREAGKLGKRQKVFLQINISRDGLKRGFSRHEIVPLMRERISRLKNLSIRGLMTITMNYKDPESARGDFRAMRELREVLESEMPQLIEDDGRLELSMGMSADYVIAIEEGATVVRIGSALLGERSTK